MKKLKLHILVILIVTAINLISFAQAPQQKDSLLAALKKAKTDTGRVNAYVNLCRQYQNSNLDTALQYGNHGLSLAIKANYKKGMVNCYSCMGVIYMNQSSFDKAIDYYLKALKINEELGNKTGMSTCYNNIGLVHRTQGNYDKALEYHLQSLKIDEELGDKKGMAMCYNNIGNLHFNQGSYNKALRYYLKSLDIKEKLRDSKGMIMGYNNVGSVYFSKNDYDNALKYYLESFKIAEELADKNAMAMSYGNIGIVYASLENYDKAIEYYVKDSKIVEELGDKYSMASIYVNLASLYSAMSDSGILNKNQRLNYLNKAIEYGIKALNLAKEINAMPVVTEAAHILMVTYKNSGDYKLSVEYAETFVEIKDSMFKEEKTKALADMEAKYQNVKKQLEIDKLGKEKELQISENKKQRIIIFSVIAGFLLIVVFAIFVSNRLQVTRKQKRIIENQKDKIEKQHDLVTQQKQHIEIIHEELTDSIRYAERIQNAILPSEQYIHDIIPGDFFILFKPKDIVSGDFYFVEQRKNMLLIAVADCTGHGVPGGFMSMLGISFLNEIIAKEEVQSASFVLDELRQYVIHSLQQKGVSGEQKDGMDICFVALNTDTNELQYAGANNPLYVVASCRLQVAEINTDLQTETCNLQLYEIKPDKQPIGIYENMKPFTNNITNLQKGDTIYLMSDGYEDQFGGTKDRKFLIKNLKQLISENCKKSLNEQKEIFNNTIENWKNYNATIREQTDDITILGIKI